MARKSKKAGDAPTPQPSERPVVAADAMAADADGVERGKSLIDEMLLGWVEAQPEGDAGPVAAASEEIDVFATQWTELDLRCRDCQIIHYVPICLFLNAADSPGLVQAILHKHFNMKRCPVCHQIEYVEHPYAYYDPKRKLVVQVRPEWEWHAGGGEEWYAARLEDLFDRWAEHDVQIEVVFGPDQLIDRFLQDVPLVSAPN